MNRNEFNIVLPSNSSTLYYPLNTTTNCSTRLSKEVELYDRWLVGLSEIHIPCTTLHLRREDTLLVKAQAENREHYFQHGTYDSIQNLVEAINDSLSSLNNKRDCSKLTFNNKGGFIVIKENIKRQEDGKPCQNVIFSEAVKRILGLEDGFSLIKSSGGERTFIGKHPASLARAIPDQLFVYSNLCEPCMLVDTSAPLLRIVNVEAKDFSFGSTIVKKFAPINYIPLLNNRFQTVDIDIRDQFGNAIAFEFGTLTVTLHFKREF